MKTATPIHISLKSNPVAMTKKKQQAKPAEKKQLPKPKVDDQFWFDKSADMVDSAVSKRNEAAAKLQKFLVWLWGIYTASASVGIALSKTSYSLPVIILIASPSAILIIAYWLTVWVQMPLGAGFDARIPGDIKANYFRWVSIKSNKLRLALALSLFAAVLVSLALIAASLSKQAVPPNFKAYYQTIQKRDSIAIAGHFPADTKIILRISSVPPSTVPGASKELLYVTSQYGELQKNIELDFTADKYDVEVEWQEKDGLVRSLKRTVTPKKNKD